MRHLLAPLAPLLLCAATVPQQPAAPAVRQDMPIDASHPAAMHAFVLPSHGDGMNAVLYAAAGAAPHPTLVLLHGFPGNEQNLDLAQAARRAGWNVLTFHYRGSWGSRGTFSFNNCLEDAKAAVAFLRGPDSVRRYAIDPARIAVAGHSMGGAIAARVVADDPGLLGTFLIDPADLAQTGRRMMAEPAFKRGMIEDEIRGDLPPLATSETAIVEEWTHLGSALDLAATVPDLVSRPLALVYAQRGIGSDAARIDAAARKAGHRRLLFVNWPTDHPFSDHRIALADLLVRWLVSLPAGR